MIIRSNMLRQEAHQFYEKVGYQAFETQLTFRKELANFNVREITLRYTNSVLNIVLSSNILMSLTLLNTGLLFGTAFVAGGLNAVAGGGSFLTFPTLIFTGINPIVANATNNIALMALPSFPLFSRGSLSGIRRF